MRVKLRELAAPLPATLHSYLRRRREISLHEGYELGRRAIGQGVGLLPVATLYHGALAREVAQARTGEEAARLVALAKEVFAALLSPYEMGQRGYLEARASRPALRSLNQHLEQASSRAAHVLYEEVLPLVASVHLELEALEGAVPEEVRGRLGDVRAPLAAMIDRLRGLAEELGPTALDDLGLVPALETLAAALSRRFSLAIMVEGSTRGRLAPRVETALYRIAHEALLNAGKHARASQVRVQVDRRASRVRCMIRDNGVGFDVSALRRAGPRWGLGLRAIRDRAEGLGGNIRIGSSPGNGTRLMVGIPL